MNGYAGELIREAWRSIQAHRVRSILTALGVIIGVAAVISVLALGRAATLEVGQSIGRLGTHLLFVRQAPGISGERGLTMRDGDAIRRAIPAVTMVTGQVAGRARISVGRVKTDSFIRGVSPDYVRAANLEVIPATAADGGFFQRRDQVILGRSLAKSLFDDGSPLGRRIRLNGVQMTIVGVAGIPAAGVLGDPNDFVLLPLGTARQRFGLGSRLSPDAVETLLITVDETKDLEAVAREVRELLDTRSGRRADEPDAYLITSTEELTKATGAVIGVIQGVLSAIAAVSLLVGGIGIANMMLVSVTERTSEIGLRKALGARSRDIQAQFLIEGALLCGLGGAAGLLVSWALVGVAQAVLKLHAGLSLEHALLGLLLALATGVLASWLPARRASRLSPADALRQD